jgi:hypothetical protein
MVAGKKGAKKAYLPNAKAYNSENVILEFLELVETRISFASMTGSALHQLFPRQMLAIFEQSCEQFVEVFASQNNGGDMETVIKERISWFEYKFKMYKIALKKNFAPEEFLEPKYYIVTPQLKGTTSTSLITGKKESILAEEVEIYEPKSKESILLRRQPDFKIISKAEMLNCFENGKAFKPEWIANLAKCGAQEIT